MIAMKRRVVKESCCREFPFGVRDTMNFGEDGL